MVPFQNTCTTLAAVTNDNILWYVEKWLLYRRQLSTTLVRLIIINQIRDIVRLHIFLTLVVCFTMTNGMSYLFVDSFIHVIIQISSIYSFSHVISVYMYYARASFPYFTHSLGVFWLPRFAHLDIGCFVMLIRCSLRLYASWGPGVSFYWLLVLFPLLYSCCLLDFLYIVISLYSISLFIIIMREQL